MRATLPAVLAAALGAPAQDQAAPARTLRILDLQGTPFERGLQHGQALAAEIREFVAAFERDFARAVGEPAATLIPRFLAETRYDEAIRRFTPGLLDEVRGLAAGAGQPFPTMLAYQLIDEQWAQAGSLRRDKCTTIGIAARGDQPTLVAQNLDVPRWMHAHPTVLRIHHPDRDLVSLVVTLPGLIGAMGCNSGRVAIATSTVLQLAPRRDGLPVAFVVRGMLEQPDDAAARGFLQRVPHACGQAYLVGGPAVVTCHEASAHKVVPFVPPSGPSRVWHTNHPLASDDWNPDFVAQAKRAGKEPGAMTFACSRFAAVADALAGDPAAGAARVVALLAAPGHRVCNDSTYVGVVMTLGERPELRVSPGPPDRTAFATVPFTATK